MLGYVSMITAILVVATGLYVLAHGDWHKFGLKFAGVSLSTTAAAWLLGADLLFGGNVLTCQLDSASACLTLYVYHIMRNTAFLIFHIAVGRDAIRFKNRDRRGTQCQKNTLKQSYPS